MESKASRSRLNAVGRQGTRTSAAGTRSTSGKRSANLRAYNTTFHINALIDPPEQWEQRDHAFQQRRVRCPADVIGRRVEGGILPSRRVLVPMGASRLRDGGRHEGYRGERQQQRNGMRLHHWTP